MNESIYCKKCIENILEIYWKYIGNRLEIDLGINNSE